MATKKKLLQAAAGSAGGAGLDIPEVFSTYLYTGNGGTMTINNNIDLATEGGLVWEKNRSGSAYWHHFRDSETGADKMIELPNNSGLQNVGAGSFTTTGYTAAATYGATVSGRDYVSWTFRKAPKFFDIQTWSGTSSARTISHNLGCTPGMIIIKCTNTGSTDWVVWHNGFTNTSTKLMYLNTTDQEFNYGNTAVAWGNTAPTSTEFTVGTGTFMNETGKDYVAYIFAHNNGDGEFGPDQDQDIIKCGAYTGNGGVLDINLGFEVGWVIVKKRNSNGTDWHIFDEMRGMPYNVDATWLEANTTNVDDNNQYMSAIPTGFRLPAGHGEVNNNGDAYIYMAIRRGFLNTPDDVDAIWSADYSDGTAPVFNPGFPVDMGWTRRPATTEPMKISSRPMRRRFLDTTSANAETANNFYNFDYQGNWGASVVGTDYRGWSWRRAHGFFDVVPFTGTGSALTVSHNLGVVPEMIILKNRTGVVQWTGYHKDLNQGTNPENYKIILHLTNAEGASSHWNNTSPTSSNFTVGSSMSASSNNYVAHLFASLDGISKVGSWTGTNPLAYQTIDCGFSSSPRFILIKRVDAAGDWYLWDSVMGGLSIGATDEFLQLNTTDAKATETSEWNSNVIAGSSTGFRVVNDLNEVGHRYIFYAIA